MTDRFAALDEVFRLADFIGLEAESFEVDGAWHRCRAVGDKKRRESGTYILSEMTLNDGRVVIVGLLNNFLSGQEGKLTLDDVKGVTAEEAAEARRKMREAAEANKRARAENQLAVADKAAAIWAKLPDSGRSLYLDTKRVKAWGVRFSRGSIVVPARDVDGRIWTLQFIDAEGNKRFLSGGAKRGRFHLIKRPEGTPSVIGYAEGYATAATIAETLNIDIAVTFDAGNLLPVAQLLKGVYPDRRHLFFADHDVHKGYPQAFIKQSELIPEVRRQIARLASVRPDVKIEIVADDDPRLTDKTKHPNTGVAKAILAAAAVDGDVVIPRFNNNQEERREQ